MAKTTETTAKINYRKIIGESVEFVRRNGGRVLQLKQTDRLDQRANERILFAHELRYCPCSTLSEDHTRQARMLDISLEGVALLCPKTLAEGFVVHVCLPLPDGKTAWVEGRIIYCIPSEEHYRVGIAFLLDEDQS